MLLLGNQERSMDKKLEEKFEEYRTLISVRAETKPKGKGSGTAGLGYASLARGNKNKNKILNFYVKNGRWPKRTAKSKTESKLGTIFENLVSKESGSYDLQLREIVMSTGRKSNNKRKHNVKEFKVEIIEFIKENGRVPASNGEYEKIEGEATLRGKLDYYTLKAESKDMTFLGEVYSLDRCHRSGVPSKFRPIINSALDIDKPLIRLPIRDLEAK